MMKSGELSVALTITVLILMIFTNASAILDVFAQKFKVKPPTIRPGKGLTEPPLAKRTRTTEVQVERAEIAKPVYKIEFRQDLASNVEKYIREFNTDLYNTLVARIVAILPNILS